MSVYWVVALLLTLTLLVTSLLLVYPVVRQAHAVAHREGFLALAASFFLLTLAATDGLFLGPSTRTYAAAFVASVAATAGVWYFARPFLRFDDDAAGFGFDPVTAREDDAGFGPGEGDVGFEPQRNDAGFGPGEGDAASPAHGDGPSDAPGRNDGRVRGGDAP